MGLGQPFSDCNYSSSSTTRLTWIPICQVGKSTQHVLHFVGCMMHSAHDLHGFLCGETACYFRDAKAGLLCLHFHYGFAFEFWVLLLQPCIFCIVCYSCLFLFFSFYLSLHFVMVALSFLRSRTNAIIKATITKIIRIPEGTGYCLRSVAFPRFWIVRAPVAKTDLLWFAK